MGLVVVPSIRRFRLEYLTAIGLIIGSCVANAEDGSSRGLEFSGDLRLRLEQDWDSRKGDDTKRDDRLRLRFRLRAGFNYVFDDRWSTRVSIRSGKDESQQSSHITIKDFNGGDDGPYDFNFDHWYVTYQHRGFEAWAGRNEPSFLHQTELFVFDNITYAGAGGSYRHEVGSSLWYASFNYLQLPVGMQDFVGTTFIGQLVYNREFDSSGFSVGLGYDLSDADPDDSKGELLLTENNTRDYSILSLQTQYRTRFRNQPLKLGFDYSHNLEDYSDEPVDSFSEFHDDDVNGYAGFVQWGNTSDPGDWQVSYYYVHQEALTTNSSYTQDEWVRWGGGGQVRATNLRGSEFRLRYAFSRRMNILARLYLVDAIDFLETGDIAKETGNRFRVDWNLRF